MPFRFSDQWYEQKSRADRMAQLRELAERRRHRREAIILAGVIVLLTLFAFYL